MNQDKLSLERILETMDVPEARKDDMRWLSRNLAIRNSEHSQFDEASSLIKKLLRSEII